MKPFGKHLVLALIIVAGLIIVPTSAVGDPSDTDCTDLRSVNLEGLPEAPTRIDTAEQVPATAELPEHCLITGYVAPQVRFEVRLPVEWNGNFFFNGCGGLCGAVDSWACGFGLNRGYASATTDTGHAGADPYGIGSTVYDALWAYGDESAVIDWAHRGVHVATIATKKITELYYADQIDNAYFVGCSNGGRQALIEAQRYPDDYDGIFAGDPGLDFQTVALNWVWAANANLDENGKPIITEDKIELIHNAVISQCDTLDGRADKIIDDPRHCRVDPSQLSCDRIGGTDCLDDRQVTALRKLYATPTDARGRPVTAGGLLPGSEGNWADQVTGTGGVPPMTTILGDGMLRYLAFDEPPGPSYDPRRFDFDSDPKRMRARNKLISATDPDLADFRRGGGRLIMSADWADGILSPEAPLDYYRQVSRRAGGPERTAEFFRFFMIPGKNHCSSLFFGSPSDPLDLLAAWVERGAAPERVTVQYDDGLTREFPRYR